MESKESKEINKNYLINNLKKELYTSSKFLDDNKDLSKYIHDNINLIKSEPDVMLHIYKKIISANYMIKNIIEYEFIYYEPEKKLSTMEDIIKLALTDISKFQNVIGGYDLEDNEWLNPDELTTKRFDLKTNQKIIYNTLAQKNRNENNNHFMKLYIKYIKRFISDESRISVTHKLINDDENEICWVIIMFEKMIDYLD